MKKMGAAGGFEPPTFRPRPLYSTTAPQSHMIFDQNFNKTLIFFAKFQVYIYYTVYI